MAAASALAQQTPSNPWAPTGYLNRRLPKWLSFSGELRPRAEGFQNGSFTEGRDDAYFLNRFRLNMNVTPAWWMKFSFHGQDARIAWNDIAVKAPPNYDPMDLRIGYLELGDVEKTWLTARLGRQELNFGEERLLGSFGWSNVSRSFDAVRLTLRHKGYRLDAFAASVVQLSDQQFNKSQTGDNMHGMYGQIADLIPDSTLEPYAFWRVAPSVKAEDATPGKLDLKTFGVRWFGKLPASFDYNLEAARQIGSWSKDRIGGWGLHARLGHNFPARYSPRLAVEYNHGSGDSNPSDGKHETFDVLYPTGHDKYGLADQVGWKNMHHIGNVFEFLPIRKLRTQVKYHNWWVASTKDGIYAPNGALRVKPPAGPAPSHIGQELDFQVIYPITPKVVAWAGVGHIFPGGYLEKATPGAGYTFPYTMLVWTF